MAMSLGMISPPAQAESLNCEGGKVEIIGGVVVCTKTAKVKDDPCESQGPKTPETVFVYFARPSFIQESLKSISVACASISNSTGDANTPQSGDGPKSIIIVGTPQGRSELKEHIFAIDLPRDRISLDLWAIQISSASPAKLANVMGEVQRQIDATRSAMQETYREFVRLSQATILDPNQTRKVSALGYQELFPIPECNPDTLRCVDPRASLNLTEMLINLNFAQNRIDNYNNAALNICNYLAGNPRFQLFNTYEGLDQKAHDVKRIFNTDSPRPFRRPFQNFMTVALHQNFSQAQAQPRCGDGRIPNDPDVKNRILDETYQRRLAIMNFAEDYSAFQRFQSGAGYDSLRHDERRLRRSTTALDSLITPIVDALQRDIEDYFIRPTLHRIRQIVSRERDVEYAEVGRTTIAALNGLEVTASSKTVTSMDEPTPLRLNQLLSDAAKVNDDIKKLQPALSNVPIGSDPSVLSASSALALAAALTKEETRWRAMNSGVELTMTPTVFLDRKAAELKVKMKIGNPAQENASKENPLRPLSRISESNLETKVYVNTMDLFALSSFNNQTTLSGRRWYVPLVGSAWEGVFGDIPVLGTLFSFKRPTHNVQHQSIILANTLITPSAMGMTNGYCGGQQTCKIPRSPCQNPAPGASCTPYLQGSPTAGSNDPARSIPRSRVVDSYSP